MQRAGATAGAGSSGAGGAKSRMLAGLSGRSDRLLGLVDGGGELLVSRFVALVQSLSSVVGEDGVSTTTTASAAALSATSHSAAIVRGIEDLQKIVREVRAAWVLGTPSTTRTEEQDGDGAGEEEVLELDVDAIDAFATSVLLDG
ncbi:hypothetical protein PYCC9005_004629 [Savitreella phatthalungensis]